MAKTETGRAEVERLLGELTRCDNAEDAEFTRSHILHIVEDLAERLTKAEENYRIVVEKAADKSLAGYRELGQRAANAEILADMLRLRIQELEKHIEFLLVSRRERDVWSDELETENRILKAKLSALDRPGSDFRFLGG